MYRPTPHLSRCARWVLLVFLIGCDQPVASPDGGPEIEIDFEGDIGPLGLLVYSPPTTPGAPFAFEEGVEVEIYERASGARRTATSDVGGRIDVEALDWSEGLDLHWRAARWSRTLASLTREGLATLQQRGQLIDSRVTLPVPRESVEVTIEVRNVPPGTTHFEVYKPNVANTFAATEPLVVYVPRGDSVPLSLSARTSYEYGESSVSTQVLAAVRIDVGARTDSTVTVDFAESGPRWSLEGSARVPDLPRIREQVPILYATDAADIEVASFSTVTLDAASGRVSYTLEGFGEPVEPAWLHFVQRGPGSVAWGAAAADNEDPLLSTAPLPRVNVDFDAVVAPGDRLPVEDDPNVSYRLAWVGDETGYYPWQIQFIDGQEATLPLPPSFLEAFAPQHELAIFNCGEDLAPMRGWACDRGAGTETRVFDLR